MLVYRIYDRLTGKNYIGQTSRPLNRRIYSHLHDKNSLIGRAMNENGLHNFDISVLDVCEDKAAADQSEKFWIDFYNSVVNGYNIHTGGTPDKKYMDALRAIPRRKKIGRPKKDIQPEEKPVKKKEYKKPLFTARELYNAEARLLQQIAWRQNIFM